MVSTLEHHTIPRFYGCYLLQSLNPRRQSTYIGSTPDPPRRIKQHNGIIAGGAFKTKQGRPWHMQLVVHGFPSKLQALQFEWAWQNPHASRHLRSATLPSAQFPRTALSNKPLSKVQVLQFMLCSAPWSSFNLEVTLFCTEAEGWWKEARRLGPVVRTEAAKRAWEKKGGGVGEQWGPMAGRLDRVGVNVRLDGVDGTRRSKAVEGGEDADDGPGKLPSHDSEFFDPHWAKWNDHIAGLALRESACGVCHDYIDVSSHLDYVLCASPSPAHASCCALFHFPCLAKSFQSSAASTSAVQSLLPTDGTCPTCRGPLHWQDLVRGAYRREEEADGRGRKKPRAKLILLQGSQAAKRKGKGKEVQVEDSDEERFALSDEEALEDDEEQEQERSWAFEQEKSWAQMSAEEGGAELNFMSEFEVYAGQDGGWEDDGLLIYEPTPSPAARTARTLSSPSRPTTKAKTTSRSRSPKQTLLKASVTKPGITAKSKAKQAPRPTTPPPKERIVYEVLSDSPSPPPAAKPKARRIAGSATPSVGGVEKRVVEVLVISDSD